MRDNRDPQKLGEELLLQRKLHPEMKLHEVYDAQMTVPTVSIVERLKATNGHK